MEKKQAEDDDNNALAELLSTEGRPLASHFKEYEEKIPPFPCCIHHNSLNLPKFNK